MTKYDFDQKAWKGSLKKFFTANKPKITSFGNLVNQTFEAATFALVIKKMQNNGWHVEMVNPKPKKKFARKKFQLKFSTRGAPQNYSYAKCTKDGRCVEIRHQLRVKTIHQPIYSLKSANIVCDIAIIDAGIDFENISTDEAVENHTLKSFCEVKHMSAYAELIASFVGLVHELKPSHLTIGTKSAHPADIPSPFLHVSGVLNGTAESLYESTQERGFDIDVFHLKKPFTQISPTDAVLPAT